MINSALHRSRVILSGGKLSTLIAMYSPGNSSTDFASLNSSLVDDDEMDSDYISIYPLDYRIIATLLQTLIFLLGISGNIVVIIVILRTKSLHSPTYTYLVRT